ncbi:MAG: glycosyltransferase [Crocinitomicaceae bacterium]|nr:glycosyltransferase [Crocinitomicaceae bacterium]
MKISVITVSFNSARTIRDTIESVLNQTYSDIEYIIVDGASKDDTLSIIKSYGNRISKLISEKDNGIYDAMNKGIKAATGDVIGILNSDDFYSHPDVIKNISQSFNPNTDAVYADLVYVSAAEKNKIVRTWKAGKYETGSFRKGWMPPHPTFFVKRMVYENFGLFTDELKSAADYEIMLRFIHLHNINLNYLPEIIVHMRTGGASNISLKNRIKANREDKKAWKMNGLKPSPLTFIRKPLSKLSQFFKR